MEVVGEVVVSSVVVVVGSGTGSRSNKFVVGVVGVVVLVAVVVGVVGAVVVGVSI